MTFNGSGRERVAQVLAEASDPLPAVEVSRLAGLPLQQTLNRLADLTRAGRALNCGTRREPLYVTAALPVRRKAPAVSLAQRRDSGVYTGEAPIPVRAGSMDFLRCGSVENGEWVERKRPVLMSYREE